MKHSEDFVYKCSGQADGGESAEGSFTSSLSPQFQNEDGDRKGSGDLFFLFSHQAPPLEIAVNSSVNVTFKNHVEP